ncbi:uncharacterized protein LOC135209921 [Macrobrachium nipponense]|uniref:uncharacterized protein LOC135209921 n=1 Tax=Macrobrachium nipponense TaxID=159736 RepID=UPI0030C7BE50
MSVRDIARGSGYSITTVYRWINRWQREGSIYDKPRRGRPRVTSSEQDRQILRAIHAYPKQDPVGIVQSLNYRCSWKTIQRRLEEQGAAPFANFRSESHSIQTEPETGTERIFLATWMWAGLILSTAYCGVLTSLLAVPKVSVPVDSLQDLVAYKKIPWAIERGTFLHQVFAEATSGVYKMINDGGSLVTNGYDERDHIKTGRIAVLCDVFTMKKIMSDDYSGTGVCNYYIAEKPITSVALAFAFPKGSDLVQHFDRWLGPLKESGLVGRSVASLTANATACLVKPGKEGVKVSLVISLQDLAGLIILTGAGMLLGFISLVLEWLTGVFKSPSMN